MATSTRVKRAELRFIRTQLKIVEASITPQSLKEFSIAVLELYLSSALVLSLFECPDPNARDKTELKYMYRLAWIPLVWGLILAFGHTFLPQIAPSPDNFERNVRLSKYITWCYSLVYLIYDKDMVLKKGPGLQVALLFSCCDIIRYEMEAAELIAEDEEMEEENDEIEFKTSEQLHLSPIIADPSSIQGHIVASSASELAFTEYQYDSPPSNQLEAYPVHRRVL